MSLFADMRAWAIALMLMGCGNKEEAPKQQAAPPAPTPADAATGCFEIEANELAPVQVWVNDIAWRSPTQLVLAIGDNPHNNPTKPEQSGIALYDLTAENKAPITYRMPATDVEIMGNTALVVGRDYVTRFELDTACVRQSERLDIRHAAIDRVRGRFFLITGAGLVRIETTLLGTQSDAALPSKIVGIAYDPTSDRVLVRSHPDTVEMFDGATLKSTGSFKIHAATQGGPWIRPGTGEAWFTHFIYCEKREFSGRMPVRKNLGKCLDDPKTVGSFLTRYELPSGTLIETIQALGGKESLGESGASFSGDGKQFFIADVFEGHLQAIGGKPTYLFHLQTIKGKPQYTWGEGWSLPNVNALDDDGDRLAGWSDSYYLTIFETTTGKKLWNAHLPGKHPY